MNDYDLWGRLSAKKGTWTIESLTTKNQNNPNSSEVDIPANFEFIHFYIRTEPISFVTVDVHTANFYNGDNKSKFDCEAEEQRVVFKPNAASTGEEWTVKENKRNRQVWTFTNGSTTTTMTLARCNCDVPGVQGSESGG